MLTGEPPELMSWRRFAEPATVVGIAAALAAVLEGRNDLCRALREHAAGYGWASLAGIVLFAAASVLVVEPLARVVHLVWSGRAIPAPLSALLLRHRRRRWHSAGRRVATATDPAEVQRFARRRTRIALAEPQTPTWMGDRLAAASLRVRNAYGLDLPSAWPRLWLLLPDSARSELRQASLAWHGSVRWAAWAILYCALAVAWWPLIFLAAVTMAAAVQAGRATTATLTSLMESTADLYWPELAAALDCVDGTSPGLSLKTGKRINRVTRKGI